jgi:flagellar motor switch protein FliG
MELKGKQKAAMLLTVLSPDAATELLKGLPPKDIEEVGMELARIDASKEHDPKSAMKIAKEFYNSLRGEEQRFSIRGLLNEMLVNVLGRDKAQEIQSQIRTATVEKDPFMAIRSAGTDELVLALGKEHPQTIAIVLSELPTDKSQEILANLDEEVCSKTVCRMANPIQLGTSVKRRIAATVTERLKSFSGETLAEKPEQSLRKLALVIGGLEPDLRNKLLDDITKLDKDAATMVRALMVTWEDIPSIVDRSLQEALRTIEAGTLAVALYGADEEILQKIRSNISERAAAMLDEEAGLIQEPLKNEILDAREEVVKPLREANEQGKLRFIGR